MKAGNFTNYSKHLLLSALLFTSLTVTAKDKDNNNSYLPFHKGTKLLGLSLGISFDNFYSQIKPHPIPVITYDQGLFDNLGIGNVGVGGIATCKFLHYTYPGSPYTAHANAYYLGLRGTYHFTFLAKKNNNFDPYAGLMLGLKFFHSEDTYRQYKAGKVSLAEGIFIGARYRLDDRFSAFSELGYDISFISIGVNVNL